MKKVVLIAVCLIVVFAFTACSKDTPNTESPGVPATPTSAVEAEDIEGTIDHEAAVQSLGFLMEAPLWTQVEDIPVDSLIMWYAHRVNAANIANDEFMAKYTREGADGYYFPAQEFEGTVYKFFGLDADYLRQENELFDEETLTYATPAALIELRKTSGSIYKLSMEGPAGDIIYFKLPAEEGEPLVRALTVVSVDGNVRFVSYTDESGKVNPAVAIVPDDEQINEDEPGSPVDAEDAGDDTEEEVLDDDEADVSVEDLTLSIASASIQEIMFESSLF